jgi:hypothetical protein
MSTDYFEHWKPYLVKMTNIGSSASSPRWVHVHYLDQPISFVTHDEPRFVALINISLSKWWIHSSIWQTTVLIWVMRMSNLYLSRSKVFQCRSKYWETGWNQAWAGYLTISIKFENDTEFYIIKISTNRTDLLVERLFNYKNPKIPLAIYDKNEWMIKTRLPGAIFGTRPEQYFYLPGCEAHAIWMCDHWTE